MMTISEYVKLAKGSVSKEDDEVVVEPTATDTVTDTESSTIETPAKSTAPVEEVDVTTQVEFDTTNSADNIEATEVPSDEMVTASDELNDTMTETDEVIENQETTAEVHEELAEEVPVLETKLESPENITPADVAVVTESLKYKLKRLDIPLNNSRALTTITGEDCFNAPANSYAIAIEDEKTLLQKTGDALKRAWEWIRKQFGKLVELVKRVFGNVKAQGEKMIADLNKSQNKEATVSKEAMTRIAKIAPTEVIARARPGKLKDVGLALQTISISIEEFVEASDKEKVKQSVVNSVNKLNDIFYGAFSDKLNSVENKDYGVKGIVGIGDKYISVALLNLDGENVDVKYEKVSVEAPEANEEKITADKVIAGIKSGIKISSDAVANQNAANNAFKNNPVEIKDSKIKTYLTNRWINRLALTGYQDVFKYANGKTKYYMALGREILGQKSETKEEKKEEKSA